jgi:hypothetical protein
MGQDQGENQRVLIVNPMTGGTAFGLIMSLISVLLVITALNVMGSLQ